MSRQSHTSANDNDNEMILGAVQRCGIYLKAEESPLKPQLGNGLMKAVRPLLLQMESFTSKLGW